MPNSEKVGCLGEMGGGLRVLERVTVEQQTRNLSRLTSPPPERAEHQNSLSPEPHNFLPAKSSTRDFANDLHKLGGHLDDGEVRSLPLTLPIKDLRVSSNVSRGLRRRRPC